MGIILASQSPRRRELFSLIAPDFFSAAADIDEYSNRVGAADISLDLARQKCRAVARDNTGDTVVACDTLVALGGEIFGKPRDRADAFSMLRKLSGREHEVFTGVAITSPNGADEFTCRTLVVFFDMSDDEINAYIDTGEPFDKAGAYGIQGPAARFVSHIDGDYFNVMGLPVSRVYRSLKKLGVV